MRNSKETILNQALAMFGRIGFDKTTMGAIADASKRGRRTIYTYFKSKEDVFDAVIERELKRVIDALKDTLEQKPSAADKMTCYVELRLLAIIDFSKKYKALRIAFLRDYDAVERMRKLMDAEEKLILRDIIRQGEQQGLFAPQHDMEQVLQTLTYLIRGAEFILIKENKDELTREHITNLNHYFLNGILHRS